MKKLFSLLVLFATLFTSQCVFVSCDKDNDDDYYAGEIDDEELDKIIEKMRAHGLRITKAQLAYCRNEYNDQEQNQGVGLIM